MPLMHRLVVEILKLYKVSTSLKNLLLQVFIAGFVGNVVHHSLASRDAQPELYRLRIGTLDTPLQQKPSMHIFAASKAEWDCITDDLPQYIERP